MPSASFSAGQIAARIHRLLHEFRDIWDAGALLAALNNTFLADQKPGAPLRLTTVATANYNCGTGEFSYAYAGHPRMLLWRVRSTEWCPLGKEVDGGGLNFLQYRHGGSEVSIEPNGNVYPCCIKTKMPIGNVARENLETILERLVGNPVYEAISMGHPERMGITAGWSVDTFLEKSTVRLASGKGYQNLCIGCDRFHEEVHMNAHTGLVNISR
jgi:hypothetical protein